MDRLLGQHQHTNIHIKGFKEGEKVAENLFEDIVIENISNLEKETDIQVQEAQKLPSRINLKRSTSRHII